MCPQISQLCCLNISTVIASLTFRNILEVKRQSQPAGQLFADPSSKFFFCFWLPTSHPQTNPFYFQQQSGLKCFWSFQDSCFLLTLKVSGHRMPAERMGWHEAPLASVIQELPSGPPLRTESGLLPSEGPRGSGAQTREHLMRDWPNESPAWG